MVKAATAASYMHHIQESSPRGGSREDKMKEMSSTGEHSQQVTSGGLLLQSDVIVKGS